jgi:hypothetical protein
MIRPLVFLCALLFANFAAAQDAKLPPREDFHLILLVGQSNMAGRGTVEAQDRTPHPRVLMLDKANEWVPAIDPLHFDKPSAGVGLGKTFGALYAEAHPGITVGLIPCAVGGSPIDAWKPGEFYKPTNSHPWDDAMRRAQLAQKSGAIVGILWHQGESDSNDKLAPTYEAKLHDLIARMRKELGAPEVPFVVGQMGKFDGVPWDEPKVQVDRVHQELPKKVKHTAYVSAEGLKHRGDKVHFDSPSLREFGKRYFAAFQPMQKSGK